MDSEADLVILPVQDLLGLGADAHMNSPGTAHGNWRWTLLAEQHETLRQATGQWLRHKTLRSR